MLNPQSSQGKAISDLFNFTTALALAVLALVVALVVISIIRFRARGDSEEPEQVSGSRRLEIAWTVGPLLIVTLLLVLVFITMGNADPGAAATEQPEVIIIGHQWWWEARYPRAGVTIANEIHLPTRRILAELDSADVIHSFWVPPIGRKEDLTPGFPTKIYFSIDTPGVYDGACAEYCGTEHAWMLLRVVAQSDADFNSWLSGQARQPALPTSGPLAAGLQVFKSKTCISCHDLGTLGPQAAAGQFDIAPDLSHVGSRTTIGSGILTNTSDNLTKWLQDPQKVKPGVLMPNVQLSPQELSSLVSYLESLK